MPKRLPICARFTQQSGNRLAEADDKQFGRSGSAWQAHLDRLGSARSRSARSTQIATEGALWGQRQGAHGLLATQ